MMTVADNEDLGLSLSLSFPADKQLNPKSSTSNLQKLPWIQPSSAFFPTGKSSSSDTRHVELQMFLRGIDVNRSVESEEEDLVGISSPNSTVSSVSGNKRLSSERLEPSGSDELEMERTSSRGTTNSDEDEDGDNSRKKLRLSKDQSALLEESFKERSSLNPKQKLALAKQLGLRPRQVEVWFQNRRARTKLKQTEIDLDFLKRCCENLTEENRRLQKEVQELRTLKHSPHFYMPMSPPTTLTMCPSCERVGTPTATPSSLDSRPVVVSRKPAPFNLWDPVRSRS